MPSVVDGSQGELLVILVPPNHLLIQFQQFFGLFLIAYFAIPLQGIDQVLHGYVTD
jgi:hypothetical protein